MNHSLVALAGGMLIGLAAVSLMAFFGRIAGRAASSASQPAESSAA
jgi:hypothetical protein